VTQHNKWLRKTKFVGLADGGVMEQMALLLRSFPVDILTTKKTLPFTGEELVVGSLEIPWDPF
jgi:hypothetical protein